jgi:hypothetical protein
MVRGTPRLGQRRRLHARRPVGRLRQRITAPEVLRTLRPLAALERTGTPEARGVIDRVTLPPRRPARQEPHSND